MTTDDGFGLTQCHGPCGLAKLSALFAPSQLRKSHPRCIACCRAISRQYQVPSVVPSKETWHGGGSTVVRIGRPGNKAVPLFDRRTK